MDERGCSSSECGWEGGCDRDGKVVHLSWGGLSGALLEALLAGESGRALRSACVREGVRVMVI